MECQNEASIHIRELEYGRVLEQHFCQKHAIEAGYATDTGAPDHDEFRRRFGLPYRLIPLDPRWCISLGDMSARAVYQRFGFVPCDCGDGTLRCVFPEDHVSFSSFEEAVFVFNFQQHRVSICVAPRDEIDRLLH